MTEIKTTSDLLKTLTPHEVEVLRTRFGLSEKPDVSTPMPTKGSNGDDGAGDVPAPAKPPRNPF